MSAAIYDIPVRRITGAESSLAEYKGKVVLVVNVASKCGLTPQYEGLEELYRKYRDRGFVIAGFPANDFAGQEPGTNEEIQTFCTTNFGVDFPMFDKITVVGAEKHPLYAHVDQRAAQGGEHRQGSLCRRSAEVRHLAQRGAGSPVELREISGQPVGRGRGSFRT